MQILSYRELLELNEKLKSTILQLKKEKEEFEKCVARPYPPNQSYKDLEEELIKVTEQRKKDIDELWNTEVIPLRQKVEEQDTKLSTAFKFELHNTKRIKELEKVIEKQNVIITLAAGYISASKRFSNIHPMDVKKWLMGEHTSTVKSTE